MEPFYQKPKEEYGRDEARDLKQTDLVVKREEEEMEMTNTEDRNEDGDVQGVTAEFNALREKFISATEELEIAHQRIEDLKSTQAELHDRIARLSSDLEVVATEKGQELMSLVSIFLQVHPLGLVFDYICSYLVKMVPDVDARYVESLLRRFPGLFKEISTGIGATLEKKWTFVGFNFGKK